MLKHMHAGMEGFGGGGLRACMQGKYILILVLCCEGFAAFAACPFLGKLYSRGHQLRHPGPVQPGPEDMACACVHISCAQCPHANLHVQVMYPKRTDKPLYHGLVTQLQSLNIPFLEADDILHGAPLRERFDVVIDAIFGFSFRGAPRPPFAGVLEVPLPLRLPARGQVVWEGLDLMLGAASDDQNRTYDQR